MNRTALVVNIHEETLQNLSATTQWLLQREADFLKKYALSTQQFTLLKILKESHPEPVTVKQLKKDMPDKMSDVSRIVERMRRKGLLNRTASETDRRSVEITLTGKGLGVLYEITQSSEVYIIKEIPNLSGKELSTLNQLLDKIRK